MMLLALQSYFRDYYRLGLPFYPCNDGTSTETIHIAFAGTKAELDQALKNGAQQMQAYDIKPRKTQYVISDSMQPCPQDSDCYYEVDSANLTTAIATYCVSGGKRAVVTIMSAAQEPLSQTPNYFSTAEISGFICVFIIFALYFLATLYAAMKVKEPIMLPKDEAE